MARLTIYKDKNDESTVISNLFIDSYMKDANDAQLKVYLYLVRMMNAQRATSVSDIADQFNHTEKEVVRALKYWEKNHLLDLDYDEDKNLIGIHIRDLNRPESRKKTGSSSSFVPTAAVEHEESAKQESPVQTASLQATDMPQVAGYENNAFEEKTSPFEKPSYSIDQLKEFKNRENTAQLLFIAESYIGKPLTSSEMKTILYFSDVLKFSDDLIDYLIQYCVDRGKKDFKYMEKVAVNWAEQNICTPKQAKEHSSLYDKKTYSIMHQLGKSSTPTAKEAEYINRWTRQYAFTDDIIFEACQRTVMATDKNRFEYAEKILHSWSEQNVHCKDDILHIDELFRQRKKTSGSTTTAKTTYVNRFNQFPQNSYDFDALEKELLSN